MAVQDAGAFAVVLELVPAELARAITDRLDIPTIGIGAGPWCSGEIQVITDVVGLTQGRTPRHAQRFGEVGAVYAEAVAAYRDAVTSGTFPSEEQSSTMDSEILDDALGQGQAARPEPELLAIPLDRDL
jgi:3-methyl-2-oxobutanoate hydroxymethyltransferase